MHFIHIHIIWRLLKCFKWQRMHFTLYWNELCWHQQMFSMYCILSAWANTIDIEASLHRTPSLQIELASSEVFYYRMCHSKAENGQFNTPYINGIAKMCFCCVWLVNGFCVLNYLDSRWRCCIASTWIHARARIGNKHCCVRRIVCIGR